MHDDVERPKGRFLGSRPNRNSGPRAAQDGIESMIGNTPVVRFARMFSPSGPAVYLKMEQFNPGGSIKDRTAQGMLRWEEQRASLRPGTTIVESSSGNTAIGLSLLAQQRGYRVIAVCDRHLPAVKRARLQAFGARIAFLPDTPVGMDTVQLRIAVAERISATLTDARTLGQYSHPGNVEAHYQGTGPEILERFGGGIAAIVVAVGTCGTISGVGRCLKEADRRIVVTGVEPEGSIVFGGKPGRYLVQGGGLDFVPPIFDPTVVDRGLKVSDAEAVAMLHEAARTEGWLLGGTAGLVLAGLRRIAGCFGPSDRLVGIVPDAGDRYIDSLFNPRWLADHGIAGGGQTAPLADGTDAAFAELDCSIDAFDDHSRQSLDGLRARLDLATAP